jgi:hypothetical protein
LRVENSVATPINISGWHVQSYVSGEGVTVPKGDAGLEVWTKPIKKDILLNPGDEAYLITGNSPINGSFRENMCTGYLSHERRFTPSLTNNCPSPHDEMERYAHIELDNDSCYAFVDNIYRCEDPGDKVVKDAELNTACDTFITKNLSYAGCVQNHAHDPLFYATGTWRIYFERNKDLWRSEREIIRLIDRENRVVDVIEL